MAIFLVFEIKIGECDLKIWPEEKNYESKRKFSF